ncbi:MAG TPA: cell division protein FtsL [Gammaproteobacteria bacterium]|nr:cell division protein FtsL [Gammaproteobacteria bacterium]
MAKSAAKSKFERPYSRFSLWLVISMVIVIMLSSLGVIYSKHLSRKYFAQLQSLQKQRDDLHVEWSQLLLEQGTWATDVRVERVAREHMYMTVPNPEDVKVIR